MIVSTKHQNYIVHDENNIKGFFDEYGFLSNFFEASVFFEGDTYLSTESAYQASKCNDIKNRNSFFRLSANESKKLGQKVELRKDWDERKYDLMSIIVFDKFYRYRGLRELLLVTGDKYLEETNHWGDQYWGVFSGVGENNLGKILMGIRDFWKRK